MRLHVASKFVTQTCGERNVQIILPIISDFQSTGPKPPGYTTAVTILEAITKPKTIVELQETLQMIWDSLPRGPIDKAVKKCRK